MAYDSHVVQAARERLEQRRQQASDAAAALRTRLHAQYPRIREIEQELTTALPEVTRAILAGDSEAVERARQNNLRLQEELTALLHKAGYPQNNLEPQYTCPHCEDTGYVGGKVCACYQQLLREEACRRLSGLSSMKLTSFDDMSLAYYSDKVDPRMGISPRDRMQKILDYCRTYAREFTTNAPSLLLLGATGTGKTHLSLAIAKQVTEQGYQVVYGSMQPLLRKLEGEHFGRAEGDSENQLIDCDLLILDDLGMEFDSAFTRACLYNILNARLLEGKPTIISTNLSHTAIGERYGEQIASRITGGFEPLLCVGDDVRQLIRHRQML